MVGLDWLGNNTWTRLSRVGTLLGVTVVLCLATGVNCFGPPPSPCDGVTCKEGDTCVGGECLADCTSDDDCDTGNLCAPETCNIAESASEGTCVATPVECADDEVCDDGDCVTDCNDQDDAFCADKDACTTDSCDADSGRCANDDVVCDEGRECDGRTGECVASDPCENNADCDDGNLCTDDKCDPETGLCTNADGCPPATQCDEEGNCVRIDCESDKDCDDGINCTNDSCDLETGLCVVEEKACDEGFSCNQDTGACELISPCETDVDCDDGVNCTDDSCNPDTGGCVFEKTVCDEGSECNEDTGECEAIPECKTDTDCDDGLFCTGTETCVGGNCQAGTGPCYECKTVPIVCDEDLDRCDPPNDLDFRYSCDRCLIGTDGHDVFGAPLIFNVLGFTYASLRTGSCADGKGGDDVLNATFNPSIPTTIVPGSILSIETINLTNFGSATLTLKAGNISGTTLITSRNSVNDITVSNLHSTVNGGIEGFADAADKLELDFVAAATSGSADAMTLTVKNTTAGEFEIASTGTNGFETLTINSEGSTANVLDVLRQTDGTSLAIVSFTGPIAFNLKAIATAGSAMRTFDANAMSGGLTLGTGRRADEKDTFTSWLAVDIANIIGGAGDDTFIMGTTLTIEDADQDSEFIDGGDGTDTLQATLSSILSVLPLKNMEVIRVNAIATAGFSLLNVTGVTGISIEADTAATTLTLNQIPVVSSQEWPKLTYRGDGTATVQIYDSVVHLPFGATAPMGDSLTVEVNNHGVALNVTGVSNKHTITSLTLKDIENLTIDVKDGPLLMATGLVDGIHSTLMSLDVSGSSDVNLGTVTAAGNTLTSLNATGVVGDFTATVDIMNGGTVTLGKGNDTLDLTGSAANAVTIQGGAGNDTITSAAGADTITGGAGADTMTGGNGNDTYVQTSNDATDTITDFAAGTPFTSEDKVTFSLAAIEAYGTVADLVDTALTTLNATDAITYEVLASDGANPSPDVGIIGIIGDYADAAAALAAKTAWTITYGGTATADDAILIAYTSGSDVRIAIAVNTATPTSDGIDSVTDLIILTGVTLGNLDSGDFNNLGT